MNADFCKGKSGDIPLYALCFFCFFFLVFYNMWLTVSKKHSFGTASEKIPNGWSIRKFKKPDLCGSFLKATTKVFSPLLSVAPTSLLLIGAAKENFFLFFPCLVFVFKGILIIQSLNLLDLYQFFQQTGTGESGWKSYLAYFAVIGIDMAECFCLRKILEMFYKLWVIPKNEEEIEEKDAENSEKEVMKVRET